MNILSKISESLGFASSTPVPSRKRARNTLSDDEISPIPKRMRYGDDEYRTSPYSTSQRSSLLKKQPLPRPSSKLRQASLAHPFPELTPNSGVYCEKLGDGIRNLPTQRQVEHPRFAASPVRTMPSKVGTIRLSAIAEEPWETQGLSNDEKWLAKPNKRALEVAAGALDPKLAVWKSVKEPEYALRDVEIRDAIWQTTDSMQAFAKEYFAFSVSGKLRSSFFEQFAPETAKVIGCVASGGPGGVKGWHDMFVKKDKRQALVMAIVGNVLVEQVFQHIFFGGLEKHVTSMTALQIKHADADGFDRNTFYATEARRITSDPPKTTSKLPPNFANHTNRIVGTLYTHLKPILTLNPSSPSRETIILALHTIVTHAGILSLSMRTDPHTVYHFEPLFKEDTFTSKRMECVNQNSMQQTNPRTSDDTLGLTAKAKQRRAHLSAAEKKRARNDDPLTQITIMDGVTAYRLGGWEAPDSSITNVKYERHEYANKGVRVRKLTDGLVYCRWGRARRFKNGKGNDVAAQHGNAWNGGFVEFNQVKGVVDWLSMERGKKETESTAAKGKEKAVGGTTERTAGTWSMISEADVQELLAASDLE